MRDISGEERERERNTNLSYRIHHSAAVVLAIWSCVNYYGTSYTFFNHHSSTQTPQDNSTGSQDAAVRMYPGSNNPNLGFGQGTSYPAYPPAPGGAPYPPAGVAAPYPPAPGASPYPPAPGAAPYPPAPGAAPYPPAPGASPYPPAPGASPYPPAPGASPYPPAPGASPYPPAPGASPYPPAPGASPYPPVPGASPYPPAGAYPPTGASTYPPASGAPGYPPATAAPGYSPASGAPGYPPAPGGAPGGAPYGQPPAQPAAQSYGGGMPPQQEQKQQYQTGAPCGGSLLAYQETPTVNPLAHCDPSSDASVLRKAMKGFGTDEAAIIGVLSHRSSDQRQQILLKYQQGYGRDTDGAGAEKGLTGDLVKDLKSELSGKFEEAILALMTPLPLYLAQEVHHAIQGIGTNERTLVEVLCTRDNQSLMAIKNAYYQHYRKKLEDDLRGDTSGDFRRLLISMCACSRDENTCDPALAPNLAQQLYNAGVGKVGTDEAEFNRILSTYSYPMLRIVFEEYKKIKGKSFGDALDSELSGDLKMGMRAVYDCIQNRAAYFAKELHDSMAGMGTRDRALIRLVVSRCEIDMGNIKQEYHKMYSKSLEHAIKNDTSGDLKKLLIGMVEG
ncbi:annexin A7-like isoform X7 [Portunus trituberculatus]|uniref:annexin A7-like isoform X7 n=2 Tax=Portunus trituberculatus TaxID=210409 RepID=UPI001E1CFEB4|nr:annexin A7-like isoform X7 [Portunus trituberculatus]